ncbi:TPA: helicase, partial [Candidatus Delongbacteria bacterium]|nr:helicase [Candidatus Delongbacteria bacterium]
GYFYFSGFREIYEKLEGKHLRILVGMEVERELMNKVKEFEIKNEDEYSKMEIRNKYNESLVKIFNDSNVFDNEENSRAFKVFLEMINNGKLEVRRTLKPNHAKLYLFENRPDHSQGGEYPGTVITGSSNLTWAGLRSRYELNVCMRNKADFVEGKRIFEDLWEESVIIVDKDHLEMFDQAVVSKIWFEKLYSPFHIYLKVLDEYFSIESKDDIRLPKEITNNKYINLKYQEDAIKKAISTIERHNGVIVADVVGLGKSIIASTVAHNLGLKTIIITPPHLMKQWDDEYRDYFDFNAKVFSSGMISKALEYLYDRDESERLIIIDEAHKYRNEATEDYVNLRKICQGNKVMLLTATPFNNRPQDIFAMVSLFQIPNRSTIRTVENLGEKFADLIAEYKKLEKANRENSIGNEDSISSISKQIRDIITPLIIRRSRLDLDKIELYKNDLDAQKIKFPEVEDPVSQEYDLGDLSELYLATLYKIDPEKDSKRKAFLGARYKPLSYFKDIEKYKKQIDETFGDFNMFVQTQVNLAKFMKRLLVRRYESSVCAFEKSINNMIDNHNNLLNWIDKRKTFPIFKKGNLPIIDEFYASNYDNDSGSLFDDDMFDRQIEKLDRKGLVEIDIKDISVDFQRDVKKDIALLEEIKNDWFDIPKPDPKLISFKKFLKDQIKSDPKRKIIVFSEFADTVEYLYENMKNEFKVFRYTSRQANKQNKDIIYSNFDAGIDAAKQKNDYHILLATDAISEGYNLHRAGTVFNYDIPYNPTRVIQRVGRINRINKKVFDKLFIYNYFPTDIGEKESKTKKISTLKMKMINTILGGDTKILTSDEELNSFYKDIYDQEFKKQNELSWDAVHKNILEKVKISNPQLMDEVRAIMPKVKIQRTVKKDREGVLVFGKKGDDFVFKIGINPLEYQILTTEEAIELFKADPSEVPKPISEIFYSKYEFVKNNLFDRQKELKIDKTRKQALDKLDQIIKVNPFDKEYLQDLRTALTYDALPKEHIRLINNLAAGNFQTIKEQIPPRYILAILNTVKKIESGDETIILAEELI